MGIAFLYHRFYSDEMFNYFQTLLLLFQIRRFIPVNKLKYNQVFSVTTKKEIKRGGYQVTSG
jgi:hypothetical protein